MTLIGIVGFGHLGQAIYEYAKNEAHLEIAWVWNRSISKLLDIPEEYMLEDLEDIDDMPLKAELIVEVAHPSLWKDHAETLLSRADVVIGSPSGLSVKAVEDNIRRCCQEFKHTAFVARGALWGGEDIFRMVDTVKVGNTLNYLKKAFIKCGEVSMLFENINYPGRAAQLFRLFGNLYRTKA